MTWVFIRIDHFHPADITADLILVIIQEPFQFKFIFIMGRIDFSGKHPVPRRHRSGDAFAHQISLTGCNGSTGN